MKFLLLKSSVLLFLLIDINYAKDWWENGNFYQIYPRSFADSDGDGVGDLNGIRGKLQYLKDIGITGAWLSPIFKSPMADFGYDISDFYKIHPEFGTMEDFENLIKKAKEIGIRIFLDFVPNHTSDENEWFIKSVKRIEPYTDYYVWHDGIKFQNGSRAPPSNWLSAFRNSAWKWNDIRQQYYLHQFAEKQPDLNYRNDNVVKQMKDIMIFWLSKGVSGFRIDAVPYLFEAPMNSKHNYPDEPKSGDTKCPDSNDACYLKHIYTQDQPETFDMIYQWHDLVTAFKKENSSETKILLTEAYTSLDNIIKFYGDHNKRNGSNVPFNFELLSNLNNETTANELSQIIDNWMSKLPSDVHSNWVLGNHDNKRITTRLGKDRSDLFNIMIQTLPGIAVTYNGEEIAMNDVYIDWDHTVDPQACNTDPGRFNSLSRDTARTPFQWDSSKHSGFSRGSETWLPVADDYKTNNVLMQSRAPISHLHLFKKLIKLRQEPSLQDGTLDKKVIDNIFLYKRELKGNDKYIIVLNLGLKELKIDLKNSFPSFTDKAEVLITSIQSNYTDGDIIDSNNFIAYPHVGTVLVGIN